MYTAYLGSRLVDLLNARDTTQRTVQEFYAGEYFDLFFNNERYLQHVNNSKFDQAYKQKAKSPLTAELRANLLVAQQNRIENDEPDGSFFLGGAAAEATAGTSGQVTDIRLPISPDEVYASWIGAALGVGVSGGLNVLIDDDTVLLTLYDGWKFYRKYLRQLPNLKPHQINTWNGWWLWNSFRDDFEAGHEFEEQPDVKTDKTSGIASLETQKWVKVVFALARKLTDTYSVNAYVYALSQMNTTVGFIQIQLRQVGQVEQNLRQQLFAQRGNLSDAALDSLYNTEMGFQKACELGAIGVQALEPESLREYMPTAKGPGKPFKTPKSADDSLWITYTIYETWIIAMLDNQKLLNLSEKVADTLYNIADVSSRAKTTNSRIVDDIVAAKGKIELLQKIQRIMDVLPGQQTALADLNELSNIITTMPGTQIPLFVALLKLKYTFIEAKNKPAK